MDYAIEVSNLSKEFIKDKSFGELLLHPFKKEVISALENVSFKIKKGEVCGLLGPNGAGKTTLIKILSTLILPDAGTTCINGYDVVNDEQQVKDSIGLIINDARSFFWRLTGRQNLEFFASLYGLKGREIKKRAEEVMKIVGLTDKADIKFDCYSSGMKRKLGFARGLLINPDILLVDEPTNGLDPLSGIRLRRFLREEIANKLKKTILLATHDLSEAQEVCNKIIILNKGKIKANDTVKRLQSKMGPQYIEMAARIGKHSLSKIGNLKGVEGIETNGKDLKIKVANVHTVLPKIISLILNDKGRIFECRTDKAGLDKVFEKYAGD